jgi:hypothetical protein
LQQDGTASDLLVVLPCKVSSHFRLDYCGSGRVSFEFEEVQFLNGSMASDDRLGNDDIRDGTFVDTLAVVLSPSRGNLGSHFSFKDTPLFLELIQDTYSNYVTYETLNCDDFTQDGLVGLGGMMGSVSGLKNSGCSRISLVPHGGSLVLGCMASDE